MIGRGLVAAMLLLASAGTPATDLHRYWDDRCGTCHGDAGDFARRTLSLRDGVLLGRHHVDDLPRFLHQHVPADDLVAPIVAMLAAQVNTPPLYAEHCRACHGKASALVRERLLRDAEAGLVARSGRRPLATLLARHGGLAPAEVPVLVETLARVMRETGEGAD